MPVKVKLYTADNIGEGLKDGTWEHRLLIDPENPTEAYLVEAFAHFKLEGKDSFMAGSVLSFDDDGELVIGEDKSLPEETAKAIQEILGESKYLYSDASPADVNPDLYAEAEAQHKEMMAEHGYEHEDWTPYKDAFVDNFNRLFFIVEDKEVDDADEG